MIRRPFSGERTAKAVPLTRTREVRTAVAIVAVFATIATAHVLGGTPAGPFTQRWNLFAPAPPSAVLDTYLVVRYDDGTVSQPFDLSEAVRDEQVAHRFAPPSLVRPVTKVAQ